MIWSMINWLITAITWIFAVTITCGVICCFLIVIIRAITRNNIVPHEWLHDKEEYLNARKNHTSKQADSEPATPVKAVTET